MFKYGKKAGIMAVITMVLAVVPILVALMYLPQLAANVPMKFDGGEVARWGSKYELLIAPTLGFAMGIGTITSGMRQAAKFAHEPVMAKITYSKFVRNGLVACAILAMASFYVLYSAVTGHGMMF